MNSESQQNLISDEIWSNWREEEEEENIFETKVTLQDHISATGDRKRSNRLSLRRNSPNSKQSSPNSPGNSLLKHLTRTGRHSMSKLEETMGIPLLSEGHAHEVEQIPTSTKTKKTRNNENLDSFFAMSQNKSRPSRRSTVGGTGNDDDTYKNGGWTIKTDGFRLRRGPMSRDFHFHDSKAPQVMPPIVPVAPLKSCLKPQSKNCVLVKTNDITGMPVNRHLSARTAQTMTLKSCMKSPTTQLKPMVRMDAAKHSTKMPTQDRKERQSKSTRKVPEGYAAQLNVLTGRVEHLCLHHNQHVQHRRLIPEVTICTQLCIPKSATDLKCPKSFDDLDVRFVRVPIFNSAA